MLRLLGFFVVVLLVLQVLRHVPLLGAVFQIPFVGFWLAAVLVSAGGSKLAADWVDRRKQRALERQLGTVDTPHNLGKLGALLVAQRRYRRALDYLDRAIDGEPETAEWPYRKGIALIGLSRHAEAVEALEACTAINEDHAYGGAQLRLAQAQLAVGEAGAALAILERFELSHGKSPESAYRRGLSLKGLDRAQEARAALAEVSELARQVTGYQKRGAWKWVLRASWARVLSLG